ncbi:TerB family tellurite resistance protein [Paracoccus contaminans]|uniref:Co-chaperone DjlA N-terminal domain-containing protein n=1 Tax=Paracoccus contaminans TaxID=1945662 RepID=A0A1W6CU60_9RHOB|nr:TerB family tellurite resistance protein [Paracoccus contaminans]ARJ68366.1 hypothetical protein B0A89_00555 [Paracoccus contaminans]
MFRNLLHRLFGDEPPRSALSDDEVEAAVAALLVRMARADNRYQDRERARIAMLLGRRRRLDASHAADLLAAAEMLEAEAPDTVRFTRAVKDGVPLEKRLSVIAAMWEIALVDGERSPSEDATVRLAANLLGISDVDSALARQAAERAQGGAP